MHSKKRSLEDTIGRYHHRLELIRTIVPILLLVMQSIILYHIVIEPRINQESQAQCVQQTENPKTSR